MKVENNIIKFENQREKEIFLEILREVNLGEMRPELMREAIVIVEIIREKLM